MTQTPDTPDIKRSLIENGIAAFNDGYHAGLKAERDLIIQRLNDYFDLTLIPDDTGQVTTNLEWDNGFQCAIAVIKAMKND